MLFVVSPPTRVSVQRASACADAYLGTDGAPSIDSLMHGDSLTDNETAPVQQQQPMRQQQQIYSEIVDEVAAFEDAVPVEATAEAPAEAPVVGPEGESTGRCIVFTQDADGNMVSDGQTGETAAGRE